MMFRLLASRGCHVLWRSSHSATCGRSSFLPVMSVSHRRVSRPGRGFSTVSSVGNGPLHTKTDQSLETERLELDRWKSVMRAQAEKQVKEEVEASDDDDDDDLPEQGGDSSLEATRNLVAMWREAGKHVPKEITDKEVDTLSKLTTKSSKMNYLRYLAIREGHKATRKKNKEKKRAEREASIREKRELDGEEGGGGVLKNTMFLQYWSRSLDKMLAWRSAQAMVFGQPLVFDMSYESQMSQREMGYTVFQLMQMEGINRRGTEPYHLHFCNLQPDGAYKQELLKRYGAETWERLLITATDQHYMDMFPHERLVYLTADSRNVLRTFDHSKVYIIGAMVDRFIQTGLSLANAKRLKLATARLPLDEFLHWEKGGKNLTLDQMVRIMLTIKDTGRWEEALQFVPQRKHGGFHQQVAVSNNTTRPVKNQQPNEDGVKPSRFGEKSSRNFKSVDQSFMRSQIESGFTVETE
ncbi:tRNA methyltransferase 10 homolog C [Pholidichthys leucotaenia]